ncbi:Xylulose kinase, partial [Geodia barretti]
MEAKVEVKKPALPLYVGLDLSTQQLKVVSVDERLRVTHEFHVVLDELQEFGTVGGVLESEDGVTVTSPTLLWVKAVDVLLSKMQEEGFPFCRVVSLSGSGQQHGSVYWREGAGEILTHLQPSLSLHEQLQDSFSLDQSPVWKDSSTSQQCRELEEALGGPLSLAHVTGSRAYERFTGNQIAKIFQRKEGVEAYKEFDSTERISLVSSFLASLFLGRYASIDYSDGSGMNLLDIAHKKWSSKALEACAPGFDLEARLGDPVTSSSVLGPISPYYVDKFGFSSSCQVVAFTGDNPSSLAGTRLSAGDVTISLGTSDTVTFWTSSAQPQLMGHVFVNPVDDSAFMAMLCYKNGSKTRELFRDRHTNNNSWKEFNHLLDETEAGNSGNIGIYFAEPEITPTAGTGEYRWDRSGAPITEFPPEVELRALVEGQFMAKWVHAQRLGHTITASSRILATGGASGNTAILQIIADIFNADVYVQEETANSASLGAAYRAKHALMPAGTQFAEAVQDAPEFTKALSPRPHLHFQVYQPLCKRYAMLES